jgi:hypothetical protein
MDDAAAAANPVKELARLVLSMYLAAAAEYTII